MHSHKPYFPPDPSLSSPHIGMSMSYSIPYNASHVHETSFIGTMCSGTFNTWICIQVTQNPYNTLNVSLLGFPIQQHPQPLIFPQAYVYVQQEYPTNLHPTNKMCMLIPTRLRIRGIRKKIIKIKKVEVGILTLLVTLEDIPTPQIKTLLDFPKNIRTLLHTLEPSIFLLYILCTLFTPLFKPFYK